MGSNPVGGTINKGIHTRFSGKIFHIGGLAEWSMALVSKTNGC